MPRRSLPTRFLASYLSANHPVWWSARIDLAVVLMAALFAVLLPMHVGVQNAAPMFPRIEQEIRNGYIVVVVTVSAVAVILWCVQTSSSLYRLISPRMAHYPTVFNIFVSAQLLLMPMWLALNLALNGASERASPHHWVVTYLWLDLAPAIAVSVLFFSVLRSSLGITLTYLFAALAGVVVFSILFQKLIFLLPLAIPPGQNIVSVSFYLFTTLALILGAACAFGRLPARARRICAQLALVSVPVAGLVALIFAGVIVFSLAPAFYVEHVAGLFDVESIAFALAYLLTVWLLAELFARRLAKLSLSPR
jgi:hypothetical protein